MTNPTPDAIRSDILSRVRDYYDSAFGAEEFVPGTSRLSYAGRVFDAEEIVKLVDASLDFWLTPGRYVEAFEDALAAYLGVKTCYTVNSGSSANLLAFACLTSELLGDRRIQPGDEVVTVAAGFPTTVAPIVQFGAVPVFVDVELDTANATLASVAEALGPKTKAVMLAHTLGNPYDAEGIRRLCDENGLWLIEDNCDALGSTINGRLTGTFGHIGTSSFYPAHHITTGEGGAVYTDETELARILLSMRDWGRDCRCPSGVDGVCGARFSGRHGTLPEGYDHKYVYSNFGFNLKMTEMQAAIGCAQLGKLDGFGARRRENHAYLTSLFAESGIPAILPKPMPGADPSWFGYLMTVSEDLPGGRAGVVRRLEEQRIQTRMLFAGNMIRQPVFDGLRSRRTGYRVVGDLPNTDRIMRDAFWVGVWPGHTETTLEFLGNAVVRAFRDAE